MQPVRPVAGARLPRRPSSAAGAVVLLALGAARPAFIEVVQARGGPCALVLAGALRIARDANGRLSVCTRTAGGRWRLAPAFADVPLLDPATLVDMALAQAIDACLHDLGPDRTCGIRQVGGRRDRVERVQEVVGEDQAFVQRRAAQALDLDERAGAKGLVDRRIVAGRNRRARLEGVGVTRWF